MPTRHANTSIKAPLNDQNSWKNYKNRQVHLFIAPLYMAALTMLIVIAVIWTFELSEKQRFEQQIRTDVIKQLSTIRTKLEGKLNARLFLMRGLTAYISTYPEITQAEFAKIAKVILEQQSGIHSLNLLQKTTMTHVYPLENNKTKIGVNVMTMRLLHSIVQQTIDTRKTVMRGPIDLADGKKVFISFTPIFVTQSPNHPKTYWGQGVIIINQDSLFEEAGLFESNNSLQYALRGRNGADRTGGIFFGDAKVFQQHPVSQSVSLPNESWRLAAIPANGWPTRAPISNWLWIIGSMLALMMGILVFTVVNEPVQLQEAVNKATEELQDAYKKIQRLEQQKYDQLVEHNHTLEAKVTERTRELSQTFDHLKVTQAELIHSEKMAALGQLVAGVAHEINTPLAAIRSSVENIAIFFAQTLEQLPVFFQWLSEKNRLDFFTLLINIINQKKALLSSKERRKLRRNLVSQLEKQDIENAAEIADTLVEIGIYENTETLLPLLKDPNISTILNTAYQLATLKKSAQTITMASERAAKVIVALKKFSHHDYAGKKVSANITEGIETVLTLYHSQLKQRIEVVKNYAPLPLVPCYPDELNQVWTNLVHNALQAMNNQGTLTIDISKQNDHAVISITDSGIGIPDEIKPKIFEAFFTTKPAGEGSGLGLDIVKKIIDKHEGTMTVGSFPGQTTFTVWLPI